MFSRNFDRLIKIILKLTLAFALALWTNSPSIADAPIKILVIIDTSNSMGEKGLESVELLLYEATRQDELSRNITAMNYPTATGVRVSNFRNAADFSSFLKSLSALGGIVNFEDLFSVGESWAKEFSIADRRVYWISDGGGFGKFEDNASLILTKMNTISQEWTLIEIGQSQKMKFLSEDVSRYIEISKSSSKTILDFPEIQATPETINSNPKNLSSSTINTQQLLTFWTLAAIAFVAVFIMLKAIFKSSALKGGRARRLKFLSRDYYGWKIGPSPSTLSLEKIPYLIKGPIDEIGNRFDINKKNRFLIFASMVILIFAISFITVQSLLVSLLVTIFMPGLLMKVVHNRLTEIDQKKFSKEFPGFLTLLSSGLKSGLSFEQNVTAYCQMTSGVVAQDFRQVISEIKMGSNLNETLEKLAKRRKNDDLTWLVTAISIQRDVGGSLSSIIDTVSETIKARSEVRREIVSLSAEGKLSAYVLIALPISLFGFLFLSRRNYVEVLWMDFIGRFILVIIGVLISIGWFWMKKIVNIKV